ncbi:MAG: MgtC/SapB family protein [Clostridia bacterium]|nr:MgtC/SapB family protein [Clostridia bacterium]
MDSLISDINNIQHWFIDASENIVIYLVRITLALICGFFIGWERMNRAKGAGIRTHAIVCMASAILMIVSKYGFSDDAVIATNGVRGADTSRIAAQVVSGIGFLGAGVIFFKKDFLHGLTTAAGIWATSAIGLAIGAGMVIIGIFTTSILLILQIIMHNPIKSLKNVTNNVLKISIKLQNPEDLDRIKEILAVEKFNDFKSSIAEDGTIDVEVELVTKKYSSEAEILKLLYDNKEIVNIERTSD